MLAEFVVGLRNLTNGVATTLRGTKTGALVTTQAHGSYTEPAAQGTIMECSTAVAGVAPGTALSATPPYFLWNPPASGKNLVLLKAALGYVSGTLGAGSLLLAQVPAQLTVPTGGAELVPICTLIGAPRGVGRVFQGSTVVSVPTIMRPIFTIGAFLATTTQVPVDCVDVIDGSVVIPPGAGIAFQEVGAAGTTPLTIITAMWEEIPA